MDGCIMCENTLTTAASQRMLLLLEDVFQVSIVANPHRTLFVCSRCELNVHLIEGAMKLKREMEDHLLEALDIAQTSADGAGLSRFKRRRVDDAAAAATAEGSDGQGPISESRTGETHGSGSAESGPSAIALLKRPASRIENGPYQAQSGAGFDAARSYYGYATKKPRPFHHLGLGRVPASQDAHGVDAYGRPVGNGRLLLPHESPVGNDAALRRYDANERSLAAGSGPLHHRTASSEMQQAGGSASLEGVQGSKRRRGFPCHQCGKVMRTQQWLDVHLQHCNSSSPYDDTEGMLSDDQDSYSDDEADGDRGDSKGDLSVGGQIGCNGGIADTSAPSSAMSTPMLSAAVAVAGGLAAVVYKCKDCGKTFKRKTWLLKHAMQCVASRVGSSASSTPTSGLGGQVGSALTCNHCGKRYLGRYDKYREHVKLCSLRMNGGGAVPAAFGGGGFGGSVAGGFGGVGSSSSSSFAPGTIGGGNGMATVGSPAMPGAAVGSGASGGNVSLGGSGSSGLGPAENACHKCGESVPGGAEDLDRHVNECAGQGAGVGGGPTAGGGENTVHTCPHCGRCYAKRYDYFLRHVRSCQRGGNGAGDGLGGAGLGGDPQAPGDGEPCVCPRCSKMYRRADHLWQHMEMCRGIPGRNVGPHVCDKCGKTYGTRYDVLQRHVLTCKGVAAQQPLSQQQQQLLLADALDSQAAAQRSIMGTAAAAAGRKDGGSDGPALGDRQVDGDRQSSAATGGDVLAGVGALAAPHECGKCGKVYVLRYDHFARHVSKCSGEQAHVCGRCGRDFGASEYEQFVRHAESCDGGGSSVLSDGPRRLQPSVAAASHVCPGCGKACETYDDLWAHVRLCPSGGSSAALPPGDEDDEDEAAAAAAADDGSLRGSVGSGKMRNVCAKCGKCYVLLTCYRKHVAKCMGIGDVANAAAAAANGVGLLYNGAAQRAFLGGGSSSSPSTGSNPADDDLGELADDDEAAAVTAAIGDASAAPYECDNCGMSFGARRASFLKHVALCTGGSVAFASGSSAAVAAAMSGLHVCNHCGKHFVRMGNFSRHVQTCPYASAGGGGDALMLRQATAMGAGGGNGAAAVRQCDRCFEAMPAELFASHVERCCYGAASRSATSLLMGQQPYQQQQMQQQAPPPTWTCPRCKKEFQQSGQYIRHISTCSMEFLKCPKCDFGRYYSDSKDFDNHVTACRGKAGAAAGGSGSMLPNAGGGTVTMPPTSASPLSLSSSVDRADLAPFAGDSAAARSAAIAADPMSVMTAERRALLLASGGRRFAAAEPSSVAGDDDDVDDDEVDDGAVAQSMEEDDEEEEEEEDDDDPAAAVAEGFAAQEEVMAAEGVSADCAASEAGSGAEGSAAAFGENAMIA